MNLSYLECKFERIKYTEQADFRENTNLFQASYCFPVFTIFKL